MITGYKLSQELVFMKKTTAFIQQSFNL